MSSSSIDAVVHDFFSAAAEAIVNDRKANIVPLQAMSSNNILSPSSNQARNANFTEYMKYSLYQFRKDMTKPLFIDLYLLHPSANKYVHIERWCLSYQLLADNRDNRPLPIITRRINILLRSLYCFIRLLPGFSLLHLGSSKRTSLAFQIHNQRDIAPNFTQEPSRYAFSGISTSRGVVQVQVHFAPSQVVEEILRATSSPSSAHTNAGEASKSIPIPCSTPPSSSKNKYLPTVPVGSQNSSNSGHSQNSATMQQHSTSYDSRGNRISKDVAIVPRRNSHSERIQSTPFNQMIAIAHGGNDMQAKSYENSSSLPNFMQYNYPTSNKEGYVGMTAPSFYQFIYPPANTTLVSYSHSYNNNNISQHVISANPSPSTSFNNSSSIPIYNYPNATPQNNQVSHSQGVSWPTTPPFLANMMTLGGDQQNADHSPADFPAFFAGSAPNQQSSPLFANMQTNSTSPSESFPPPPPPPSSSPQTSNLHNYLYNNSGTNTTNHANQNTMNIKQHYLLKKASSNNANNMNNIMPGSNPSSLNEQSMLQNTMNNAIGSTRSLSNTQVFHILVDFEELKMRCSMPTSFPLMPMHILQHYLDSVEEQMAVGLPANKTSQFNTSNMNPVIAIQSQLFFDLKRLITDLDNKSSNEKDMASSASDGNAILPTLTLNALVQHEKDRRLSITLDVYVPRHRRVSFDETRERSSMEIENESIDNTEEEEEDDDVFLPFAIQSQYSANSNTIISTNRTLRSASEGGNSYSMQSSSSAMAVKPIREINQEVTSKLDDIKAFLATI